MEQRLKNIGDLADAITTLSEAVLYLTERVKVLEHRVEGTREGDPFIVPLVEEMQRLEEQHTGLYQLLFKVEAQTFAMEDTLVKRQAELREQVEQHQGFLELEKVGSRLLSLEATVERIAELEKQVDFLNYSVTALVQNQGTIAATLNTLEQKGG